MKLQPRRFILGLGALCMTLILAYHLLQNPTPSLQGPESASLASLSLLQSEKTKPRFVVDTSTCKIPEMDPFDASIKGFLKPGFGYPVDCRGSHRAWTYMDGTTLRINSSAIHESGYSESSIYCCYRTIHRVEQPIGDYNLNADNYIRYSDKCHRIKNKSAPIDADFIRVHCISKSLPILDDVVYRDFFAIPQARSDRLISRKLNDWKTRGKRPPPNVVIIGVDNNSRMNSHRHLKQTLQVLRELDAVELLGYTKVGENTFPNTVPFLSGYSLKDLEKICYGTEPDPQDDCPYIWKEFDQAGYLTVHAEDAPYLGGFNYLKTGFLKKPTDYYFRPLMLAVMTHLPRFDYYHTDCIGRYMTDELIFNYILDILRIGTNHSAPVFVHSWLTSLAHLSYNNVQFGDASIASFIQNLVKISNDNTVFFFVSDHGQRYGPIRETNQGWYEDKLPTHWVYIPPELSRRFPRWKSSLQENANRLTSHFDLYQTMMHVLQFKENMTKKDSDSSTPTKGLSLFEPVPENRTCDEAGITVNLCACSEPKLVNRNDKEVVRAAEAAVRHLASQVPLTVCAVPVLKRIVNAKFMDIHGKPVYVISFYTDPGDFLFEVNVEKEKGEFVITTEFLRMNKITRAATCVDTPLLERYCYCN